MATATTRSRFEITAQDKTGAALKKVKANFGGIESAVGGLKAKVIALAGPAAFGALTVSAANAGREIQRMAQISNESVENFQKQAFAAKSVGIETDKYADILKDVKDRVGDFLTTGGGPMADFFEKIAPQVGVTAEQFRHLSGSQALQLYIDSLQKANVSQAEMTFFLEAMASDATALVPLLKDSGAAMQEQIRLAEDLNITLSGIETSSLKELAGSIGTVKAVLVGTSQKIIAELALPIVATVKAFIQMAAEARKAKKDIDEFDGAETVFGGVLAGVDAIRLKFLEADRDFLGFQLNLLSGLEDIERASSSLSRGALKLLGIQVEETGTLLGGTISQVAQKYREAESAYNEALAGKGLADRYDENLEELKSRTAAAAKEMNDALTGALGGVSLSLGADTGKAVIDKFQQAIERLREQIALTGDLTTQETILAQIQLGKFGELDAGQKNELLNLAAKVDLKKKEIEIERQAAQEIEQILSGLQTVRDSLLDENGRQQQALENRLQIVQNAYEKEQIGEESMLQFKRDLNDQYWEWFRNRTEEENKAHLEAEQAQQERLLSDLQAYTGLRIESLKTLRDFNNASFGDQLSTVIDFGQAITGALASSSRKAFKINKAFKIADAIVNTHAGITQALAAFPPPYSFAVAGLVAARGFKAVQAIKSSQPGGGGGSASGGGGGVSAGGNSASGATQTSEAPQQVQQVNIALNGKQYDREDAIALITEINNAVGDGVELKVA